MSDKPASLRITWISLWLNIVLGILKCLVGWWVNSKALLADGLHSLVDLSTDVAAILGLKFAAKPLDENHPYGHHKFSSLASLFISGVLLLFCLGLVYGSTLGLLNPTPVNPGWPAVLVAIASLIIKEWLFQRTRTIARAERSELVMINAWHHRTDSISSLLVLVALVAVLLGGEHWYFLDKAVGLLLGIWLGTEAAKMFLRACNDLLDAAPDEVIVNDLREHVLPVPGTMAYHQFRVRRIGDMMTVDLHLQVNPQLSVAEGHAIARQVKDSILTKHPEVLDVLVHVEPGDDMHIKHEGVYDVDADTSERH